MRMGQPLQGREIGRAVLPGFGPCTVFATPHTDYFDLLPERSDRILFRKRGTFIFTARQGAKPLRGAK